MRVGVESKDKHGVLRDMTHKLFCLAGFLWLACFFFTHATDRVFKGFRTKRLGSHGAPQGRKSLANLYRLTTPQTEGMNHGALECRFGVERRRRCVVTGLSYCG